MISSVMSFLTSGDCAGYKCFRLSAEVAGWSERCCFGSLPGFDSDQAYLGASLYLEYEEFISRDSVWEGVPVSREEREMLFDDFCAAARWQRVYFLWRPNLQDASDDHVMDLAVACGVEHLVTHNVRDFQRGELHFSLPEVVTPLQHLEKNR